MVVFPLKDAEHMNIEKWVKDDVGVFCLFPDGEDLGPRWIRLDYLSSGVFMYYHDRNIPVETEPSMERDVLVLNQYTTHFTAIQWVATESIASIPPIPAFSNAQVVEFPGWKPHPIPAQQIRFFTWACNFTIEGEGENHIVTIWRYKLKNYLYGSILPSSVEKISHDSKSYGEVMSWGAAKEYYAPSCAPCMSHTKIFGEDLRLIEGPHFFLNGYPHPLETPMPGPIANSSLLPSDISALFHSDVEEADAPSFPTPMHARSLSRTAVQSNSHTCTTPTKRVFCGSVQEMWNLGNKPKIWIIGEGGLTLRQDLWTEYSFTQKYIRDAKFLQRSVPRA